MAIRTTATLRQIELFRDSNNRFSRTIFARLLATILLVVLTTTAEAVTLEWDRNAEAAVVGYRAYCGTASRSYSVVQDVGNNTTAVMNSLTPGVTYYFAVTAYTADGLESDFSEEVSYTVPGANAAPVANADSFTILKATVLTVAAANGVLKNDVDANGDPLTAFVASNPGNGTLSMSANGAFTYTPSSTFVGTDTFSYRVSDGKATSSVAVVTITVNAPPNNPPVANGDSYTTLKATVLTVAAANGVLKNDVDANGDPLTAFVASNPGNGTLSMSANGAFTYTPSSTFVGTDTFSYRVSDGKATSSVAVVTITVNAPPNNPPVANGDSYTTLRATALTVASANGVLKNDADADGDPLTAFVVSNPGNGTLSLSANGAFSYTPNSTFVGTDNFSYRASDGKATSSVAVVTITVNAPPNNPPVANGDSYTTLRATALAVASANGVLKNDADADGDLLTAFVVSNPVNGTLSLSANGAFTYTPNSTFVGADNFSYRASDGKATSSVAVVSIRVNAPTNRAPYAAADSYSISKKTSLDIAAGNGVLANDGDADGDSLFAVLEDSASHGSVTLNANGSFRYTPTGSFTGVDTFRYFAFDGRDASPVVTVTVNVADVSGPVAKSDNYKGGRRALIQVSAQAGILANDVAADGATLSAVLVSQPTHGDLTLASDGSFTYVPGTNFIGTDTFSYYVSDGTFTSEVATVFITINDAPELPCVDCYAELDEVLLSRSSEFSKVINARLAMSTNGPCLEVGLVTLGAVARAARKSTESDLIAAVGSTAECLAAGLRASLDEQKARRELMLPSRWSSAASNQIAKMEVVLATTSTMDDVLMRARLLASTAKMVTRTELYIANGTVAPEQLSNLALTCSLTIGREKVSQVLYLDGSDFVARDLDGRLMATGTYTYRRGNWNQGTLTLTYHGVPRTEHVAITFTANRWRLVGQQMRGFALSN